MTLSAGTRLGPYEVVAPLGAGGMGEVWRGRDTRLDRSVAIKVLPAEFSEDAQFKLRFEREARTISQLNHPHICTLYDVGDGYLVMELLEGESLADRLNKGPLPLDQVLRYGIQIAEALEKAHKAGVVHRDLKPGNIMLTKSGAKLLDFGLAKPAEIGVLSALTSLRTEKRNLTEEGVIIGTFQYMAPEQIEGSEVDARTDIFALGALLYEMATGRHAFEGKSKASLIASILTAEPQPLSAVQPMTPVAFDRVVRTCLQKDPDERWQSAHDVAIELRAIGETSPEAPARARRSFLPWSIAAALALTTLAMALMVWRDARLRRSVVPTRTYILPPEKTSFDFLNAAAPPAISPDGRRIVFGATEPGQKRTLYIRALDSLALQRLAGTEDAIFPFWSSDGRFVAFFADNTLKKIEVSGGAPVVVCNIVDGRGGSWSPDGQTIIFGGRYTPIYRVAAAGGMPVEVTQLGDRDTTHRWPEFLPDSHHFLYLGSPTGNEDPANTIYVGSIDGKTRKPLITAAAEPHYLTGSIIFTRDHILTAQRFDLQKLTMVGDAVPLREQQIEATPLFSKSVVAIAQNGTLVYQMGLAVHDTQLVWFDRSGKTLGNVGDNAPYASIVFSPDEKSLAFTYGTAPWSNLWVVDLTRGAKTRITFSNAVDFGPIWSPDGQKMIYSSMVGRHFVLYLKDLGSGKDEDLMRGDVQSGTFFPATWSPDGKIILYGTGGRTSRADIWWMSLAERKPHLYLGTPFVEVNPRFSPDGRWVAYQSNESGASEIYVAPFPPTGAKWQVSTNGGVVPRWRGDGKELFYLTPSPPATMWAVPILLGPTPQIGRVTRLFQFFVGRPNSNMYDVSRDGQRFLINDRIGDAPPPSPLIVVQNFENEVRAALEHRE